jgi:hypothetical protein
MGRPIEVQASQRFAAPPEAVRSLVGDYRRRGSLLSANYLDWTVESGGTGAGTVVTYRFQAGSRVRPYRLVVDEDADGSLVERDTSSSFVNRWSFRADGSGHTEVTLESSWTGGSGIGGFFERTFAPGALRRSHHQLLANLAREAASGSAS